MGTLHPGVPLGGSCTHTALGSTKRDGGPGHQQCPQWGRAGSSLKSSGGVSCLPKCRHRVSLALQPHGPPSERQVQVRSPGAPGPPGYSGQERRADCRSGLPGQVPPHACSGIPAVSRGEAVSWGPSACSQYMSHPLPCLQVSWGPATVPWHQTVPSHKPGKPTDRWSPHTPRF